MQASRIYQALLIFSAISASWLGMQDVHEFGHALGAWLTGGKVERIVLHPLTISRTDLSHNPNPLPVVWAGPIVGVLLPLLAWSVAGALKLRASFLFRFFAGFCLIANGAYIGLGSLQNIGDAGEMFRHGSPVWLLWLFGLLTTPPGLGLWNGQGKYFGLGSAQGNVDRGVAIAMSLVCVALLAIGLIIDGN
jgi:hypothetical protein